MAVDCVHNMASVVKQDNKEMLEKIENYKIQLGKYHGMLIQDLPGKVAQEKTSAFSEALVSEHKNRLIKLKDETGGLAKNADAAVDVLFSLRVNALQTPPEKRQQFV